MGSIRITGIIGSPRKNKNTDTLVQKVLEGCQKQGALIDKIYLKNLEISPCKAHKSQDGKGCMIHDGMDIIYKVFSGIAASQPQRKILFLNTYFGKIRVLYKVLKQGENGLGSYGVICRNACCPCGLN